MPANRFQDGIQDVARNHGGIITKVWGLCTLKLGSSGTPGTRSRPSSLQFPLVLARQTGQPGERAGAGSHAIPGEKALNGVFAGGFWWRKRSWGWNVAFCLLPLQSEECFGFGEGDAAIAVVQLEEADLTVGLRNDHRAV